MIANLEGISAGGVVRLRGEVLQALEGLRRDIAGVSSSQLRVSEVLDDIRIHVVGLAAQPARGTGRGQPL